MTKKEQVHNFLEYPQSKSAYIFQAFIVVLILFSVAHIIFEFFYADVYLRYEELFVKADYLVLFIFTVEYLVRLATAPSKWGFAKKPMSLVDFVAVFPTYLEFIIPAFAGTTSLRVVRLVRLFRFARVLRVLKLFRYSTFLKKIFNYQNTILETITPVIIFFTLSKVVIWVLEAYGLWLTDTNLGELFAIIGFALGIILSQKIGMSYDKFIQVEEAVSRIYARLQTLETALIHLGHSSASGAVKDWGTTFIALLENTTGDNFSIHLANKKLYELVNKAEPVPADLFVLYSNIAEDSAFCLTKKVRLTPKVYDTLLHQSTALYLFLICIFIPGITGLISVLVGTYILYGMYKLTQDLDSIYGGDYNLINIDSSELKKFINYQPTK